jgi:YidC/Oxa1 family membrane protein insertase
VFAGPKERPLLEAFGSGTEASVQLGYRWVAPLTRAFLWLLHALYAVIPNYGVGIVLLTILVRLAMQPLNVRQMRSMKRMSELQPKVQEIQKKYADDRQKQSEETMKLYREAGVNPLGGCFPILLQFPVLMGLYYALQSSIDLRQAPFLGWIRDLSAPEALFTLPGLDLPVRFLPIVMGLSMVVQQKLTPSTMDPAQARMMMTVMPVMFTVMFYQLPSGLVLYWFVSNLLAIGSQIWMQRGKKDAPARS